LSFPVLTGHPIRSSDKLVNWLVSQSDSQLINVYTGPAWSTYTSD